MINQEFLSNCADEQINKGVAWLLIKAWGATYNHKRKSIDYYCCKGLLKSIDGGGLNYCTNPNDIMPIAFENRINQISPTEHRDLWRATATEGGGNWSINDHTSTNTNPLRAICEVYILMSVTK